MTDFETAMLTFLQDAFLQDASNEFNSEEEVEVVIKRHAPKLLDKACKVLKEENEPTLREAFDSLKKMAKSWGAVKADTVTDDGEWQYTIAVKRLKRK